MIECVFDAVVAEVGWVVEDGVGVLERWGFGFVFGFLEGGWEDDEG